MFATICIASPGAATGQSKPLSKYLKETWGSERGFPGGTINVIAQTPDGYLWVGTSKGLVRFDGLTFRLFSQTAAGANLMGPVLGLLADGEGNLWVRLGGSGLLRYRDGKFDDYTNKFDSAEVAVTQMCRGADGSVIFATILNGIVDYHDGKFTSVARSPHLPDFLVTSMVLGPDGAYWLGTRDLGVYHLRDGRVSEARDVLTARQINALLSAGAKQLWIGTDKGLLLWNGTELTQVGSDSSFRDRQILSLAQDGNGNIWVGTDHGMYRLDPKSNFLPKPENAEGDGPVTSIFADREGNIWAATPRGLQRLRDTIFTTYGVSDGLPGESNGPVHVDTDGRVWFAPLRGGLYWMKDGVVKPVRGLELDKDTAYSIAGGHGDLWVGRQLGGLTHLQDIEGKWHVVTYTKADGLAQNSVYTVRLSRDGAVWAGTLNAGVTRIKNGKFVTFNTENGLISNTIASILESRDGTMWFATPRGLSAFSNNHWLSYSGNDGLPSGDIDCLFEDSSGTLWIGTASGLAALRSGKIWVPAQVPDVLREPIFGLQEDANGLMWISTSNHVLMINRQRLLDPDFNDTDIREFDLADGLLDTDGVKRDEAVVSGNSGRIWFSLSRGLSVVNPSQINDNSVPALPHIEAITADNSTANLAASIRIPPSPRRLTFEYTGLSLAVPGRIRFRYFLEGFDSSWSQPVAAREAVYTNLGPGSYRFRIVASNSEGLWNGPETAIALNVAPAYYQTYWFRLSCIAVFVALLWSLYRWRIRRLKSQEKRLREAVETIPAMTFTTLSDGSNTFVNKRWTEYTGLSVEKTSGAGWQRAIHPEDLMRHSEKWRISVATGQLFEDEARFRRSADGEYRWFLVRGVPLRDQHGKIERWYGTLTDIEDRKRAEEALQRSQFYISEGQRVAHMGSWAFNAAGFEYWSSELFRIYGLDPSGKPPTIEEYLALVHPEDRAFMKQGIAKMLDDHLVFDFTKRIVRPDGEIRHIRCVGIPVTQGGTFQGFLGTGMDVTDQERLTEELRQSENHLAEAQKLTHTASWAWRLPDRKVVHLSEEWYRIYGFDPAEGTPIWEELLERIHPEDRLKWRRELEGAIVEKADYSHEFRILFPNGKVKWIHTVGHPALSKSGDLEGFVGSSTDITELKSAEQEREKLRQLEADLAHTNRVSTLGEMAASLAHEIKQPIAAAITSANSCVEWLAHEPPNLDRARAAAARIDKYGNRAAEIIDRIRSFYKKSPPQRELVDVNGIIHEMLTLLEGEAFRYSVTMRTEIAAELPKILVDRVQLQQVFMNLMLNAIEAMKDSGGELTVKSQLQDGELQFSVSDTGVGLPAEKMDQIFSAFFTTKPQGSGMGLAISRSIVESHGGQLWASANDGRGATFHFTLPTEVTEPTPLVFST